MLPPQSSNVKISNLNKPQCWPFSLTPTWFLPPTKDDDPTIVRDRIHAQSFFLILHLCAVTILQACASVKIISSMPTTFEPVDCRYLDSLLGPGTKLYYTWTMILLLLSQVSARLETRREDLTWPFNRFFGTCDEQSVNLLPGQGSVITFEGQPRKLARAILLCGLEVYEKLWNLNRSHWFGSLTLPSNCNARIFAQPLKKMLLIDSSNKLSVTFAVKSANKSQTFNF